MLIAELQQNSQKPIGTPNKEVNAEIETQSLTVETKTRK